MAQAGVSTMIIIWMKLLTELGLGRRRMIPGLARAVRVTLPSVVLGAGRTKPGEGMNLDRVGAAGS